MEQLSLSEVGLSLQHAGAEPGTCTTPDFQAVSRHVLLDMLSLKMTLTTVILIWLSFCNLQTSQ